MQTKLLASIATSAMLMVMTHSASAGLAPGIYVVENLHPEGGIPRTHPAAISADGSKVAGTSITYVSGINEALLWDTGNLVGLGDLAGASPSVSPELNSFAHDISPNGAYVVGQGNGTSGTEAVYWSGGSGPVPLGDLPGGAYYSEARGVSNDLTIVGGGTSSLGSEAFVWYGAMTGLGDLPGGDFNSVANDISADASVIVGTGHSALGQEAFVYRDGTMTGLGDLSGGEFQSAANGVSSDGTTIVGTSKSGATNRDEAFIWRDGVMTGLGQLPDGGLSSAASATSGDGSVVVGYAEIEPQDGLTSAATIWDEVNGMRALKDVLTDVYGFDLGGFVPIAASAISDDGLTIAGYGYDIDLLEGDNYRAFVVRLPEPGTLSIAAIIAAIGLIRRGVRF